MADEPKLVPIRFTDKHSPYNAGEIAGFPPALAKRYLDAGFAEYHVSDKAPQATDEASTSDAAGGQQASLNEQDATSLDYDEAQLLMSVENDGSENAKPKDEGSGPQEGASAAGVKGSTRGNDKDLKGPRADKMVRGSAREK
jgi:hypothetical protein